MGSLKSIVCNVLLVMVAVTAGLSPTVADAQTPAAAKPRPEYPPLTTVIKDYQQVRTPDGGRSYYTIWTRAKDGQMLAALPSGYEGRKFFIAMTIASGEDYAGLQGNDMYVYWKRYDKRLALIEPNIRIKST
ncbi:MAG: zinc-dependent metalloprotease, partial [Planctomycetota bacterium]